MNAIGYIRVSTEQQADKFGVEAQREAILNYAQSHNYNIIDWKEDHISGVKDDRPAFNEILFCDPLSYTPSSVPASVTSSNHLSSSALFPAQVDAVLVFKNDRVARDTKLYFYYYYALEKKGISLISTQEDFGEYGDFAPVIQSIVSYVAAMERKNITLRTSMGRDRKASQGGYTGGRTPFGYSVSNHTLVINPDEAEIVRIIFDMSPTHGLSETARWLNTHDYTSRNGGRFLPQNIRSILSNRHLYEGMTRYKDEWIQGVHEPILKEDLLA